ncbi:MAG: hypothetical protein V1774_10965 [Candidatus Eisenbacteria bacterium]
MRRPRGAARPLVLLAMLLATAAGAKAATAVPCHRSDAVRVRLGSPAVGDTLRLPHRRISPSSLSICRDDHCFRQGIDYRLLPWSGEVVWLASIPADSLGLTAAYRYLPLKLAGSWGRPTAAWPETLATRSLPVRMLPSLPPGANLQIGGSKTFSIEFGSQRDAKLEQSLDLTVRGELAPEVRVRAILTDRATPLQPEGTTAELSDLDQVLIELDSPQAALRLGDVEIAQGGFLFLRHERQMEGLTVRAGRERGMRAASAFGRGLGRQASLQFFGEEGKQGPYRLLGRAAGDGLDSRLPGEEAIVVAGSERVWLNGVRMRRGEDADYTIDYDAGELWFTPRHPLGSVSEIRIDVQIREGAFDRDYAALFASTGDSLPAFAVAWMREQDDASRGAAFGLTDDEKELLRAAGDGPGAVGGGVTPDSLGEYALVEADSLDAPFFLYVGEAPEAQDYSGRYEVEFTDVGEGEGAYAQAISPLGRTYYVYAGRERGRYVPGRRLSLPESREVASLRAGGHVGGGLSLHTEGALSRHDRNTLSAVDDGDNQGAALLLQGDWQLGRLWGGRADLLQLRFAGRDVDGRFSSPEPLADAFEYRRWNASADSILDGRDRRGQVGLVIRPGAQLNVAADWERIKTSGDFGGSRWSVAARREGRIIADLNVSDSRTREAGIPGGARRVHGGIAWTGDWGIGATVDSERLLRGAAGHEEGESFDRYGLRAQAARLFPGMNATLEAEWREDHRRQDGRDEHAATRRLYRGELDYQRGSALAHALLSRSTRTDAADGSRTTLDLADWSLSHRGLGSKLTGEWRGRVTTADSRLRLERLRFVGGDGGHYDSLGRYVGLGDYELYYEPGDSTTLETRLESVMRLGGRPFAARADADPFLAGFESSLFGRIELATGEPLGRILGDARELFGGGDASRTHERLLRGDLSWEGASGLPVPRVRAETRRGRERTALGALRSSETDSRSLELRWTIRRGLRGRAEYGWEEEGESIQQTQSGALAVDERSVNRIILESHWTPFAPLTLRIQGERLNEHYRPSGERRGLYKAIWGAVGEPLTATRLELSVERRWSGDVVAAFSPFWIERPGWRVTCTGSWRPKAGLTGTLWIRTDREEGRNTVVSGRMEARAFF